MLYLRVPRSAVLMLLAASLLASAQFTGQSSAQTITRVTKPVAAKVPPVEGLNDADFDKLHKMIKPQPGEALFHQVPWYTSVWEARVKAAAEGKPILIWSGSGGPPLAIC